MFFGDEWKLKAQQFFTPDQQRKQQNGPPGKQYQNTAEQNKTSWWAETKRPTNSHIYEVLFIAATSSGEEKSFRGRSTAKLSTN